MKTLIKTIACTLPVALVLTGCNSLLPKQPVATQPTIAVQDTYPVLPPAKDMIRLKEGQTVAVPNTPISVTFNRVTADDRCPLNTQCIWAGNATVSLTVKNKDGNEQALSLSSGDLRGELKRKASVFGQTVSLETVYPTPTTPTTNLADLAGKYLIDVKVVPTSN